jgi:hypothetical protein
MPHLVLYSTNTYLKFRIQREYRETFFAWCSPVFEGKKRSRFDVGAGQPPSSDPHSIYWDLRNAVEQSDGHNTKINEQKTNIPALAVEWNNAGEITNPVCEEIAMLVSMASFKDWRPLIYVIPAAGLGARVELVARNRRASSEPEYIVKDLMKDEFDVIEP